MSCLILRVSLHSGPEMELWQACSSDCARTAGVRSWYRWVRKRDWENLMTGIASKRGRSSADAATCSETRFGSRRVRWRASIERGDELEHRIALEVSAQAERRGAALDVTKCLERRLARH